ncbi:MAG: hypothetical protein DSY37_04215 [Hyperthermus sp.]|nr:MAG: hypothetical protein DSY37_04215 [Hyperthermus sp.]
MKAHRGLWNIIYFDRSRGSMKVNVYIGGKLVKREEYTGVRMIMLKAPALTSTGIEHAMSVYSIEGCIEVSLKGSLAVISRGEKC